jgi:hypothetical protein
MHEDLRTSFEYGYHRNVSSKLVQFSSDGDGSKICRLATVSMTASALRLELHWNGVTRTPTVVDGHCYR